MNKPLYFQYEELAAYFLNLFKEEFGLKEVEGKQKLDGKATQWEIDAKGILQDGEGFIVVECKRLTTRKVVQEVIGGLAYRISDLDAKGGIIVTPIGLQEGAENIAKYEGIIQVILSEESTENEFDIYFFDKFKGGRSLKAEIFGVKEN